MTRHSIDFDDYFQGPRDIKRHSKWPYLLRMHGSILPKMIIPLLIVTCWATLITCISRYVYALVVNTVLLTVLGFVVGLGLSFRSSTAYERYAEGARYWASLLLASRNLARLIWIHAAERHEEDTDLGKSDLLSKVTALNLISGFAVALKHRLRFEAAPDYPDLAPYVDIINTMASNADTSCLHPAPKSKAKVAGEFLGVTFAESNPRKLMKRSTDNLGNIPHEILSYLQAYIEHLNASGTLTNGPIQSNIITNLNTLADVATGTERIVNHPMPLAYSISIAQITWAYVLVLPFQLYKSLEWITIPGTIFAAYIILGLGAIGAEIENPFGGDVNDLPLDSYCRELQGDLDVLTSISRSERSWTVNGPAGGAAWLQHANNKVLWPLSASGWGHWEEKPLEEIREALWEKAVSGERMRKSLAVQRQRTVVEAARGEKLQGVVESVNRRKGSQTDTEETKATGSEAV
jgi:ion channel-forming bestrophin family protein